MRTMTTSNSFKIAVLPGDGIGPEVMAPALEVMAAAQARVGGFSLDTAEHPAGAGHYRDTGDGLPATTIDACRAADAILLAAAGLPDVRYPDGTEIVPQIDLRMEFGLYAGVRPVKSVPGLKGPLADERANALDFVIVRESTEGLFATMGKGAVVNDFCATETMVLTRPNCERLFDFCYGLTRQRKQDGKPGRLTLVDKANVFTSFAWMRKIFDERGEAFPDIERGYAYVDAAALDLIRRPWMFDVMVTENMYGDILSDMGAGLAGGMGMAPSADIGDGHAVFQPCHGTAPDITGQGKANPTAMILSASMMLDWLGREKDSQSARVAGRLIEDAVGHAFATEHLRPIELGGDAGTETMRKAVLTAIEQIDVPELET
jgi:3-isopropylmalate dehydrogenase